MLLVVLVIATLLFIGMLQRLQVGAEVRRAVAIAVDAGAVVRSKSLTEEEKQKAVQKAAIASFASFLSLLVRVALAASGATLVIALGMLAKLYSLDDVLGAASDWVSLLAVSVAALAAWLLWR
jgi:hypothetical protein